MLININGELLPPADAKISVLDHGFLFGDSVYEVVRTVRGDRLFTADEHLTRLEHSAERIGLTLPLDRAAFKREFLRTHGASGHDDSYLRLVVTRGAGEVDLHPDSAGMGPVWLIICKPLPDWGGPATYDSGVKVSMVGVQRNAREALDPQIKSGNYLNNVLALIEARKAGASEGIMCNAGGFVTEGTTSNIFCVRGDAVCTPALETGILGGITRQLVLDLAAKAGYEVIESKLRTDDFIQAAEVFTSTTRGVMPVTQIDEHTVETGSPGTVTRTLMAAYEAALDATEK